MITRKEAIKLVDEVSLEIAEGRDVPVFKLTKLFDFILEGDKVLLTVKDVCHKYSIGNTKVYDYFNNGLKKTEFGGTKIRVSDLEEFIANGKA